MNAQTVEEQTNPVIHEHLEKHQDYREGFFTDVESSTLFG